MARGERSNKKVYGVKLALDDMVQLRKECRNDPTRSTGSVDKTHYYAHPEKYESIFHTKIAPHITVIVNGIYWDPRFPRLLTNVQLKELRQQGNYNLKLLADITCDVKGSVEFLSHTSNIEKPFYTYLPEADTDVEGVDRRGVLVLGEEER